ncbi:unnamed protein product, partial [Ectocarpus sp. 12 AP-2014]
KGATCALRGKAPLAQHRYCLRHLILNLEEKIGSSSHEETMRGHPETARPTEHASRLCPDH